MSHIFPKEENNHALDHCYFDDYDEIGSNVEITESCDQIESQDTRTTKQIINNAPIRIKDQGKKQSSTHGSKQQVIYLPSIEFCTAHEDLLLLEDEKLVKPGDKFKSHTDFVQYLNENAKRWNYYYKCSDSRKPNTKQEMYLYTCVYLRTKEKYVKKGMRKRDNGHKTNCPCKIRLRHLPNENELTVVFVCNHHDHPLSKEEFIKLQHGRRLPPYIKEEIMELLTLQVDVAKIRKYVRNETGFDMSRPYFYMIERMLKAQNKRRHISAEKARMWIKRLYEHDILNEAETKRSKSDSDDRINRSETLQSVRNLQQSTKCEIQHNPWINDQSVPVLSNGVLTCLITNKVDNHNKQSEGDTKTITSNNSQSNDINNGKIQEFDQSEDCGMAYETVISETEIENVIDNVTNEYVYEGAAHYNEHVEDTSDNTVAVNKNLVNDHTDIINYVNNDAENVEHLTNNGIECVHNDNEDVNNHNSSHDEVMVQYEVVSNNCDDPGVVEVQDCNNVSKQTPLVSTVFDVCMKDGNVVGFVVNSETINQLKNDRVEKDVQTEEINNSDTSVNNANDTSATPDTFIELKSDGVYIKHEYIHKYNIHKYMCQPCFPKYIEVLSIKTGIEVLEMFTNIYNEKAMFKMTTTQSDKEGNTRMLYVTNPSKVPKKLDKKKKEELGKHLILKELIFLKDKMKALENKNLELKAINKQLMSLR